MQVIDWIIIVGYVAFAVALGSAFSRKASTGVESFFLGDKKLPWWIAGTSIVATTFAADTPLAVTGIVAKGGIAGNWIWWSWAIAHLVATFFFAKLWRRAGVLTDAEITELRYAGKAAAALRATKAVYFGLFINCLTMAWVIKAMVKISGAFFDWPAALVIVAAVSVSVLYTTLGGFRSVVITDVVQFAMGMAGAVLLAWYVLDDMGGLGSVPDFSPLLGQAAGAHGEDYGALRVENAAGVLSKLDVLLQGEVKHVLALVPAADNPLMPLSTFVVFVLFGWWRYAEGNGYIVQRLAACKDEGHAQGAALWFAIAHNALRPWPWILVALGALVVFPVLDRGDDAPLTLKPAAIGQVAGPDITLSTSRLDPTVPTAVKLDGLPVGTEVTFGAFMARVDSSGAPIMVPATEQSGLVPVTATLPGKAPVALGTMTSQLGDREAGYAHMMARYLPPGLLGLVVASLLAAFMSTIDTHTNWGASYLVQDVYLRFINPAADEKRAVWVSRAGIVGMAVLAGLSALVIDSIAGVWGFLITLGAGLGSVSAARWYWARVTPHAEFAAIAVTTVVALGLEVLFSKTLLGGVNPMQVGELAPWARILIVAGASVAVWVPVALFGPQNDPAHLAAFAAKVRPGGFGWPAVTGQSADAMGPAFVRLALGSVALFGTLFGLGEVLLGSTGLGAGLLVAAAVALALVVRSGRADDAAA